MRDLRLGVRTLAWCSVLTSVAITVAGCSSDTSDPGGGAGTSTTGGTAGTAGTASTGGSAGGGAGGTGATGGSAAGGSAGTGGTGGGGAGGSTGGGGAGGSTGGGGAGGSTGGGGAGGSGGGGAFALTSPNLTEGAAFEDKYTCAAAGFNNSLQPELNWTAGPAGTESYAITFIDRTLAEKQPPDPNGYHWVIYNIPKTVTSLAEEFKMATSIGAMANSDYLGPCPNFVSSGALQTHNYEFKVYALDTATITITGSGTAAVRDAETKLEADNLASATLGGTSDAAQPANP